MNLDPETDIQGAPWVVVHTVQGTDDMHSYPVKTVYGPVSDEASADVLRASLERPTQDGRETIVECWPLTPPPTVEGPGMNLDPKGDYEDALVQGLPE
jgi:hypothetical protein